MIPPPPPPSFDLHHLIVLDALFSPFFVNNFPYFGFISSFPRLGKSPKPGLPFSGPGPTRHRGGWGLSGDSHVMSPGDESRGITKIIIIIIMYYN